MRPKLGCWATAVVLLVGFVIMIKIAVDAARDKMLAENFVAMQVKNIYLDYEHDYGKPPSRPEDLQPYADKYPKGFNAIKNNEWVIRWGTPVSRNGDRVFAYDKKLTRKNSGWVFMGKKAGDVMSAADLYELQKETDTLHEIGQMYLAFCAEHKKPPARIEDLAAYAGEYPTAYEAVRRGEWVILWNTMAGRDKDEDAERVLGYEIKMLSKHIGWVLLADGSGICESPEDYQKRKERPEKGGTHNRR